MSRIINKQKVTYMNRPRGRYLAVCLALIFLLSALLVPEIYAASTNPVTFTVEQIITNNSLLTPPRTTFAYRLVPKTSDAPMPHGSGPGGYTFTITGTGERPVGPINLSTPGIFTYELSCVTEREPGFTVDQRIYTIEVYVTNDLQVAMTVYTGEGVKLSKISFDHIYWMPSGETDEPSNIDRIEKITEPPRRSTSGRNSPVLILPGGSHVPDDTDIPVKPIIPSEPDTQKESNPNPPSQSGTQGGSPRTGDFSNPTFWITLIVIAGGLLIFLAIIGRKPEGGGDS